MKKISFLVCMLIFAVNSFAISIIEGNKYIIEKKEIVISFKECKNNMINIKAYKKNTKIKESSFYINLDESQSQVLKNQDKYKVGRYLIREEKNGYSLWNGDVKLYESSFELVNSGIKEYKDCLNKERFYGIGEASDKVVLNGMEFQLRNNAEYGNQARLYIPFYFTNKGDSFYYNINTGDIINFSDKKEAKVENITNNEILDYYYWNTKSPQESVDEFYKLSNSYSLLPKWSFGYIQSKYGYENQNEVIDLINKFEAKKIPISAVVLDLQWFYTMGDLDWDKNKWKAPKELKTFLNSKDVKLITISEPFYTVNSKNYKEYEDNGIFAKDINGNTVTWSDWWCFGADYGAILNPIAPNAKKIAGKKYQQMSEMGIDGFWTDLGEPENTPESAYFSNFTEQEFHNYYNKEWSKLIYESMNEKYPDKRLFILSRSGFTGSAAYGVSIWSGDSTSSFEGLRKQVAMGINSGLTGFSYWGCDVGGFESGKQKPNEELFVRWMQFGTFIPIFRAHGAMSPREPWIYSGKSEDIITKYIKKRYEFLDYIYSSAFETYLQGTPIMRPMFYSYSNDENLIENETQYMFGDYIMVVPITAKNKKSIKIYFPEECYDINNFEKIEKGEKEVKVSLEDIPVYFIKGAIIPTEKDGNKILTIISGKNSSFTIYLDDGISNNYKSGNYNKIEIKTSKNGIIINSMVEEKRVIRVLKDGVEFKNSIWKDDGKFMTYELNITKGENKIDY